MAAIGLVGSPEIAPKTLYIFSFPDPHLEYPCCNSVDHTRTLLLRLNHRMVSADPVYFRMERCDLSLQEVPCGPSFISEEKVFLIPSQIEFYMGRTRRCLNVPQGSPYEAPTSLYALPDWQKTSHGNQLVNPDGM